jgi:hypothetical protein
MIGLGIPQLPATRKNKTRSKLRVLLYEGAPEKSNIHVILNEAPRSEGSHRQKKSEILRYAQNDK